MKYHPTSRGLCTPVQCIYTCILSLLLSPLHLFIDNMDTAAVTGLAVGLGLVCVAVAVLVAVIFHMRMRMHNTNIVTSEPSHGIIVMTILLQTVHG